MRQDLIGDVRIPNGIHRNDDGSDGDSSSFDSLPELETISDEEEDDIRRRTYEFEVSVISNGLAGLGPEANNVLRTMPVMVRHIMAEALRSPNTHPSFEEYVRENEHVSTAEDEDPRHDPGPSTHQQMNAMRTVYSSTVRRRIPSGSTQPKRSSRLQATLAAEVEINGIKALALFDSGSTTDSITPEFAFASKAKQFKLEEQVILQLGCVGSRSKISYGTLVPINVCDIKDEIYFDLVNIDRYDCIIGTPFMNTYGACLDFGTRTIRMNGQEIKAFSFDEEQAYVDKKKKSGGRRPPPRETAPIRARKIVTSLPPAPAN
jgi:hypothetical protein